MVKKTKRMKELLFFIKTPEKWNFKKIKDSGHEANIDAPEALGLMLNEFYKLTH